MNTALVNFNGADTDKLKNYFETKYGKIKAIGKSEEEYVFIVFERGEDQIKCIEDLKNDPQYLARYPYDNPKQKQLKNCVGEKKTATHKDEVKLSKKYQGNKETNFEKTNKQSLDNAAEKKDAGVKTEACAACGNDLKSTAKAPEEERKLGFIKDFEDFEKMKSIVETMIGVVVGNFPIYFMQCDIYEMCNPFAEVLQVDMRNEMIPTEIPYAYVFVKNDEVASHLVKILDGRWFHGKELRAFMVSDVAQPDDIE